MMIDHASSSIPWYRSLRFRLVAAAITVELVMLSALLFNSFRLLDRAVEAQTQSRLEALSPLLDAALAGRVFQRDHAEVKAIINRLTNSPSTEIKYISVLDAMETVIASTIKVDAAHLPPQDHSVAEALSDFTYDVRLPLTILNNEVGFVHFGLSLVSMVTTKDQVVREGIVIASIEILLSLLLLISGGYLITRHIRSLTQGTCRVAQGDFSARITIPGHDEIAELANNFNTMSAAIADYVNDLKTSEMRFQAIYNTVTEAIFIHDVENGAILDVNERMCHMFSCSREQARTLDIGSFSSGIPPYTLNGARKKFLAAVAGEPQRFDWQSRSLDGRIFWAEVSLSLATIGKHERLLAVVRDIGERKRAEEEIKTAVARFRAVLDSLDALVYVADMETYEVLFINRYGRSIWGDVTGKICWQALQQGQTGPCSFCTNSKLLDGAGEPVGTLVNLVQNTNTKEWYECRDQAIEWSDGRLVRMEIAINISRRKRAEDSLAAEKERLAVTLRSIGDGVITTDTDGKVVLLNTVAEKLTGWCQQEAHGRPLSEIFRIVNEQSRQPSENPVEKVMACGRIVGLSNHTVLIAKDGRERKIADSGAPIRDRESRVIGVVLVFRDVTEKYRMEKELQKVKKLESVGILAGGIAHDFNNILAAILGNINLALLDAGLAEETHDLLVKAEKASLRAKELTQQLLTFSKGGEPVRETASIGEIIRDSAEFVLHGENIACRYEIPDDLWLVAIDRGQISQVVQNIILNAKHAMPGGGHILVACENIPERRRTEDAAETVLERSVRITIRDSGIGIPASIIDTIFDPYFTTKHEGSGLGLAITHSIITKHSGSIAVESQPGEGTTFTIHLPAATGTQKREEPPPDVAPLNFEARIVIMDDEEMVREVASAMLTSLGHQVLVARNGEEAIELYRKQREQGEPVDLVIMDLTIPGGMGGKEAVLGILAIDPDAKVLVSSGYSNDPIIAHYEQYGFAAALVKPFRLEEIEQCINRLLGESRG